MFPASSELFLPLGAVLFLLFCVVVVSRGARRRARRSGDSRSPSDSELDRLRADLDRARRDGDAARIQALEDQIRTQEYWRKREESGETVELQKKQRDAMSDWKTDEKRFNNFR